MTLVVARVTRHQVYMLADTRVHDPRRPRNVTGGMLKTVLLSPSVVVAFTGDIELAEQAVLQFRATFGGTTPFRAAIEHFRKSTVDCENEYILGFAGPKRLFHLHSGIEEEKQVAWIGDKNAFERFQEGPRSSTARYNRMTVIGPDIPDDEQLLEQISKLQSVLEDPKVEGVGDFFSVLSGSGGRFWQPNIGTLYFDPSAKLLGPNGAPLIQATGENRVFSFSVWAPKNKTINATAFVFRGARKGFVFHAVQAGFATQCDVFDRFTGDNLAAAIEARLGISFGVFELTHERPDSM